MISYSAKIFKGGPCKIKWATNRPTNKYGKIWVKVLWSSIVNYNIKVIN